MNRVLQRGDHGEDVALLQRVLRDMGYDVGRIDGVFGQHTENAVTNFKVHQFGGGNGVCDEDTWNSIEATFGNLDGLRSEWILEDYAEEMKEIWHTRMTPEDRLQLIQVEIDTAMERADVPSAELYLHDDIEDGAVFSAAQWRIGISRDDFTSRGITDAGMAQLSAALYDEARKAEQWFQVARVLAGRHQFDAATIASQLQLPAEVAEQAGQRPLQENPLTYGEAFSWYSEHYGAGPVPPAGEDASSAMGAINREWDGQHDQSDARPTLRRGDNDHAEVGYLQQLLQWHQLYQGLPIDGDFGADTEQAVKEFQASNNLAGDGVVGRATWARLIPGGEA